MLKALRNLIKSFKYIGINRDFMGSHFLIKIKRKKEGLIIIVNGRPLIKTGSMITQSQMNI